MIQDFCFQLKRIRLFFIIILLFLGVRCACANEAINDFLAQSPMVVYDCPEQDDFETLQSLLKISDISTEYLVALSVKKAQYMQCDGNAEEAETLLMQTVQQPNINKSTYYYAAAIYLLGFSFDSREMPERCDYYRQAQSLTSPETHRDVHLSATLGLITSCNRSGTATERLEATFDILRRYSATEDNAALAHIYNNIGLIYGDIELYSLAAEQYLKSHALGLQEYNGSNQLSTLISAIVALLASEKFDEAYSAISEFERINREVDTPLTNFYYAYALASYYYRSGHIDKLQANIDLLRRTAQPLSNGFYTSLVDWYTAAICVHNNNKPCMRDYLNKIERPDAPEKSYFATNRIFLAMKVRMYLLTGEDEKAFAAFNFYENKMTEHFKNTQEAATMLSISDLYGRINSLESEIVKAERKRKNLITGGVVGFIFISIITALILRKKYQDRQMRDSVTNLLNSNTAVNLIGKLPPPEQGKTNAIAIFDVNNFRELNRAFGSTRGDDVFKHIAQSLKNVTRDTDILGRFATEQFILCLPSIEEKHAKRFFERVKTEMDLTFVNTDVHDSVSVQSKMSIFTTTEKIPDLNDVLDDMITSVK